jgi:hypothetical protein
MPKNVLEIILLLLLVTLVKRRADHAGPEQPFLLKTVTKLLSLLIVVARKATGIKLRLMLRKRHVRIAVMVIRRQVLE